MILKIDEIVTINKVFSEYIKEKLPISLSYKIMKVLSSTEEDIKFYQEKLGALIKEYADLDENGQFQQIDDGIKVKEGKTEEFQEKYDELTSIEVEFPDIKFTLEELDQLKFSPSELYVIRHLLDV